MPHLSKKKLKKEVAAQLADHFIRFVSTAGSKKEAQRFVRELFSQTERVMLAKRLAIAVLLMQGYSFTQVEEALGVTRQTIARIWRGVRSSGYSKVARYAGKKRESREETAMDAFIRILHAGMPPRIDRRS